MKASEIKLDDWQRILFGNTSPDFLLEVLLRTAIVYLALLLVVKWLGKRMSGQITIIEMTVMITLGAIVSVPMQMPDRGILQGLLILVAALALHRGINYIGFFNPKADEIIQGKPTVLVKDGVMQLAEMDEVRVSRQQLFSDLRTKNVYQLGKLRRVYLEPAGTISIILAKEERPGLPLFPPTDESILKARANPDLQLWVCINCGTTRDKDGPDPCAGCAKHEFVKAID
jgi:uncharacterized membrane protein YcaP (DUF421 family)